VVEEKEKELKETEGEMRKGFEEREARREEVGREMELRLQDLQGKVWQLEVEALNKGEEDEGRRQAAQDLHQRLQAADVSLQGAEQSRRASEDALRDAQQSLQSTEAKLQAAEQELESLPAKLQGVQESLQASEAKAGAAGAQAQALQQRLGESEGRCRRPPNGCRRQCRS